MQAIKCVVVGDGWVERCFRVKQAIVCFNLMLRRMVCDTN